MGPESANNVPGLWGGGFWRRGLRQLQVENERRVHLSSGVRQNGAKVILQAGFWRQHARTANLPAPGDCRGSGGFYDIWLTVSWQLDQDYLDVWQQYSNARRIDDDVECEGGCGGYLTNWPRIILREYDDVSWENAACPTLGSRPAPSRPVPPHRLHADFLFCATGSLLVCLDLTRSAADVPSSETPYPTPLTMRSFKG